MVLHSHNDFFFFMLLWAMSQNKKQTPSLQTRLKGAIGDLVC